MKHIVTLILASAFCSPVFCAEAIFTISPMKLFPEAPRGGEARLGITVKNDHPLREQGFKIYVTDFEVSRDGKPIFPPAGSSKWSAAPWITLDQERITVAPLKGQVVTGRVKVPRNILTGGSRFAAIMVETVEPEAKGRMVTVVHKRAACFVYLKILNTHRLLRATLTELKGELTPGEGYTFSTVVLNEGNVDIGVIGHVSLVDENHRRRGDAQFATSPKAVFPDGEREFRATIKQRLPQGQYVARAAFYFERSMTSKEIAFEVTPEMAGEAKALPLAVIHEPESIDIETRPRSYKRQVLRYRSYEQSPIELKIEPADDDKGGKEWSAVPWLKTVPESVKIGPGQSRNISLILNVPEGARGERYAKIVSEGQLEDEEPSRWETPLSVSIAGTLEAQGEFTEMEILEPATDSYSCRAKVGFRNLGNARLNLSGTVRILERAGFKEVGSIPFGGEVYPGEERVLEVPISLALTTEPYVASTTIVGVASDEKTSTNAVRTIEFALERPLAGPGEYIEVEGGTENET